MAETEKKRTLRVPHVYTIILVLMAVFAVLTWVVPSGSFERQEVNGREVTVSGTYEPVDKVYTDEDGNEVDLRQGIFEVLEAPAIGIQQAVEVVAFIMIVGGSFQVITATGAITSGVARVVKKFKSKDVLIIPILMVLFALGGSTFGMAEETLPFFAILVLSGLQFISGDIYEAAKVDGANGIQSFFRITLPLIAKNVLTLCIPFTLWRLTTFDLVYSMTSGGPGEDTALIAYRITTEAFTNLNVGYASALAMLLFVVMAIFSWLNIRVMNKFDS